MSIPEGAWDRCVPKGADFQQHSKNDVKTLPDLCAERALEKTDLEGSPGASLTLEQLSSSSVIWNVSDVSSSGHLLRKSSCN